MTKTSGELAMEQERHVEDLRGKYKKVMQAFANDPHAEDDVVRSRLEELHGAGVAFFNAFDESITSSSMLRADADPDWYSGKGESAVSILETIAHHYRVIQAKANRAGLNSRNFRPSATAYAAMQRIAKDVVSEEAATLREEFISLGLPTHGFDHPAKEKVRMPSWQRITGVCFAITGVGVLLVVVIFIPSPTPSQFLVFRTILALAAGSCAAFLSGSLTMEGQVLKWRFRASGGLAVFVAVYLINPPPLTE